MRPDVNLDRVDVRRATLIAFGLGVAGLSGCAPRSGPAPLTALADHIPGALRASANRGREILRPDGLLALPKSVRRVWVDVGAHHLETTKAELRYPDVAVIAIDDQSIANIGIGLFKLVTLNDAISILYGLLVLVQPPYEV